MKALSHWRLATTLGVILVAAIITSLPALGVLSLPLGASFFSLAFIALSLSFAATIWLYNFQRNRIAIVEKNANGLLKSVPLIFFTLNLKMQLGRFRSTQFEDFFYGKNFEAGTDFANIVGFLANAQLRNLGCDYVKLMLAQSTTKITGENPLECASALMLNGDGRPELRHFKFNFSDCLEKHKFAGILVAIYDVSELVNINLERQTLIQKSALDTQTTLDLVIRMIKLDRRMLLDKFASFENLLGEANLDLKDSGHSGVRHQTLADRVGKKIKLLRNEAALLGLSDLSLSAADMALELETLGQKTELSGNDFFSVALKLDELYDCLHKLSALLAQLPDPNTKTSGLLAENSDVETEPLTLPVEHFEPANPKAEPLNARNVAPQNPNPNTVNDAVPNAPLTTNTAALARVADASPARFEFALIQQACIKTAEKLGKKVAVHAQNLTRETVPDRLKQPLTEILVQLIRSALANGLELPGARTAAGKDETGTLSLIWTELSDGGYELVFRDDGCGLNFETVRARALALNRLTEAQTQALEQRQLVGFIFEPGFATATKAGDNAGFGVGLDLVMAAAKRAGGKISVGTQAGQYTQFRISFPAL